MELDVVPKKRKREASSSGRSSSSSQCHYDVFLSFRGKDTRKTFTDHLYTALDNANFRTFRDNDELERGEDIKPKFMKAIRQSRSSVIVFSKDYASSSWCLNELVMILKQKRTSGHVVLPVFYNVDPSHLRKQTGGLAIAFSRHATTQSVETVNEWRKALSEAADLKGMVLQNEQDGHESRFIKKIVKEIEEKLRRTAPTVDRNLVGMDSRVKDVNVWLQDELDDVRILVIYGMRGIGKTTIAKFVYELNLGRFERHSFVENIREIAGQSNGLIQIQNQILRDISSGRKVKIHSVREGIARIEDAISFKRVLLVLDDVDCTDQLDAVFRMQDQIYPGSKIIITTNNAGLLKSYHQVVKVNHVQTLCEDESLELLSLYAFGQHHPPEAYMNHSERMVQQCAGLPLALKILGSSLSGKSIAIWESALKKLEVIPNDQILKKLKISYDSLQDSHDQDLFLHIACFFIGMDKDFVITMLSNYDYYPDLSIDNLMGRYLLTVNKYNEMEMHSMIRDMGRDIVRLESKEAGGRSRLWYHMDSFRVLNEEDGTETIVGLVLNMEMHPHYVDLRHSDGQVVLETDAFSKMSKLRLLKLSRVQLEGSYTKLPRGLSWLCWPEFPLVSIPSDFSLKSVVVIEMCYSRLTQIWKGTKCLKSLKILDVSHSHDLTETPDFSLVPNLEWLILEDCVRLVDVHDSIGSLKRLVHLNMKDCKSIRNIPKNICQLSSLETFVISGCSNLNEFPLEEIGKMKSLKVFDAQGVTLSARQNVKISWVSRLPHRLVELNLRGCNLSDDDFPTDLGNLPFLRGLNLGHNPICSLPAFVRGLPGLRWLHFYGCWRLKSLVRLPTVGHLDLFSCESLERVTFQSFRDYSGTTLYCPSRKVTEVEYRYKLEPMEKVDAEMIDLLGLSNLKYSAEINMLGGYPNYPLMIRPLTRCPIQGLYEFGIFSTFLPGNEVPGSFSHRTAGSWISLTVPSILPDNLRIRGFNFFSVYTAPVDVRKYPTRQISAVVSNRRTGLQWVYLPVYVGLPDGEGMIWLSHWKFGNKFEPGDVVTFSAYGSSGFFTVKECGIQVVYEEEEAMMSALDNTTDLFYPNVISGDLSRYGRRYPTRTYDLQGM